MSLFQQSRREGPALTAGVSPIVGAPLRMQMQMQMQGSFDRVGRHKAAIFASTSSSTATATGNANATPLGNGSASIFGTPTGFANPPSPFQKEVSSACVDCDVSSDDEGDEDEGDADADAGDIAFYHNRNHNHLYTPFAKDLESYQAHTQNTTLSLGCQHDSELVCREDSSVFPETPRATADYFADGCAVEEDEDDDDDAHLDALITEQEHVRDDLMASIATSRDMMATSLLLLQLMQQQQQTQEQQMCYQE